MNFENAIAEGVLSHERFAPVGNFFSYKVAMFLLNIDSIEAQLKQLRGCSYHGFSAINFNLDNYLKKSIGYNLREKLQYAVKDKLTISMKDKIYVLTQLRMFGVLFNPVSFYYIFHENGELSLLAEVTNTPWLETHYYVLTAPDKIGNYYQFEFNKIFHVSPFMDMNYKYKLKTMFLDEKIIIHMENIKNEEKHFDATLNLSLKRLEQKSINYILKKYPYMTAKLICAIYWQAIKIYLKGNPFYHHP